MNKHNIFTVIILFLLMIVIFLGEQKLHERLKLNVFSNNNIYELKEYEYKSKDFGQVSYIFPKEWDVEEVNTKSTNNHNLIHHNKFKSQEYKIYGDIQIWSNKVKLKDVLHNSNEIYRKQRDISNYKEEEVVLDKFKGYKVTFNMKTTYGKDYRVQEYFIQEKNNCISIKFIQEKEIIEEKDERIFKTVVDTVKENST